MSGCGCGNSKNCSCNLTNTGDLIFDGLAFECLNDLEEVLFSIPTGEPFNNVLATIFAQICASLNQINEEDPAAEWFVGAGAPDEGLGGEGDMYLDNLNGDVYRNLLVILNL